MHSILVVFSTIQLLLFLSEHRVASLICSRYPAHTRTPKSPVDENLVILVSGNPQTYILGQEYNISLNAFNGQRFISFTLALENENGVASLNEDLGHFEIIDNIETRYSPRCINMVESTNTNPKTRINVAWVAPSEPGSGCILIRATVLQHRDVWYMDDGGLTKRICEEVTDAMESQKLTAGESTCCACDEARYEVTFEGLWSRNLHPKDFPAKGWLTRFSEIIGAAHSGDYRFWEDGGYASEGMKQFAEHSATELLEKEFNRGFREGKIRTVIKARGPAFPNLNGQSIATVRVDRQHHLLSLASKIEPSPDWFVGISGLELCLKNCTWLKHKIISLYPWDAGTDAGATYISADQPQVPADVIRRMRSDFPNDPRSPFYDETGAPMKPLGNLTVKRLRLYDRLCMEEDSNNHNIPRECTTHPWTAWSECTTRCGQGTQYRERVYKQPVVAEIYNCALLLRENRNCTGIQCGNELDRNFNVEENYESNIPTNEFQPCEPPCLDGLPQDTEIDRNRYFNGMDLKTSNIDYKYEQPMDQNEVYGNVNNLNTNEFIPHKEGEEEERISRHRLNSQSQDLKNTEQQTGAMFPAPCFQPLNIFNCLNKTITGNYWFYNFCEDECMLFAADSCDKNKNKFKSMEMCDMHCRQPINENLLQEKQRQLCRKKNLPITQRGRGRKM